MYRSYHIMQISSSIGQSGAILSQISGNAMIIFSEIPGKIRGPHLMKMIGINLISFYLVIRSRSDDY